MAIHPTAIIHPSAALGSQVEIGPFCIIGPHVTVGERCVLQGHVVLERDVILGADCQLYFGAVLGGPPQDTKYEGEQTFVRVGERNIIREYVTIHRATGEGQSTLVGDDNMIMAYCHLGHNVQMGSNILMANSAGLSGHVVLEDRVIIGGMVGFHQYVRVGRLAMVGGYSKLTQDAPPFMLVDGNPARVIGTNFRGLRRAGVTPAGRDALKQAYRMLFRENVNRGRVLAAVGEQLGEYDEVKYLLDFLSKPSYAGRRLDPLARPAQEPEEAE
jgi:UDP-N-acetylglucosamine acyltransferase